MEAVVRPQEEAASEGREIGYGWRRFFVVGRGPLDEGQEPLLHRDRVPVEHDLGVHQRGGGDDQAFLLDIAQPGLVIANGGVGGGHG